MIVEITNITELDFTFQYVSINTTVVDAEFTALPPLHSNMFLLIQAKNGDWWIKMSYFTFQYVSINTNTAGRSRRRLKVFTFQYVSINTVLSSASHPQYLALHSNMFLLIPIVGVVTALVLLLYIPICFY